LIRPPLSHSRQISLDVIIIAFSTSIVWPTPPTAPRDKKGVDSNQFN
jgi:hypothetical protein